MIQGAKQISLEQAVSQIKQACDDRGDDYPFFFLVGAGISHPEIDLASKITSACQKKAQDLGRNVQPKQQDPMSQYSHWFEEAYPQPRQRKEYLKELIRNKSISQANFRLAHLLLGEDAHEGSPARRPITNLVVTVNFDDLLSKALTIFGKPYVICDHPDTTMRMELADKNELFLIHVHGTYSFYDSANLTSEIEERSASSSSSSRTMASLLDVVLRDRSPLVVGYSGWEQDAVMQALKRRLNSSSLFSNLYWFCHQRGIVDTLPSFLRDSSSVRFVVPDETKPDPDKQALLISGEQEPYARQSKPYPAGSTIPVLDAYAVFDAFNRAFAFNSPYITREPLKFLANQLRTNFPKKDVHGDGGDIYSLGGVIEKIEAADKCLTETLQKQSEFKKALDATREAIRSSQYKDALATVKKINWAAISPDDLDQEEWCELLIDIGSGLSDDPENALFIFDAVIKIGGAIKSPSSRMAASFSKALFNKGITFGQLNRSEEAIAIYGEVVQRFGEASEPALREAVARALVNKGFSFDQLNRGEEEILVYDEVVQRFGEASEPALREAVARALVSKGITLGQLNRSEEAIAIYDEVVQRFGEASEAALRALVAKALFSKGITLGSQLNRSEEAIAICDEVVQRFGEASEPALREQVARALFSKGIALGQLNRSEEAITIYDEVMRRFGAASEPALREVVAGGLFSKGITLDQLNRSEEAIAIYDEVVQRFGEASEPALREQVAKALVNKGIRFGQLNRSEEAIAICDEVVRRFGEASEPTLRALVARALVSKGIALGQLNRSEEAIAIYGEVVRRFGEASEPALREQVAKALVNKGIALGQLNRSEEAIAIYDEVVQRFGEASEPALREQVAKALVNKGVESLN